MLVSVLPHNPAGYIQLSLKMMCTLSLWESWFLLSFPLSLPLNHLTVICGERRVLRKHLLQKGSDSFSRVRFSSIGEITGFVWNVCMPLWVRANIGKMEFFSSICSRAVLECLHLYVWQAQRFSYYTLVLTEGNASVSGVYTDEASILHIVGVPPPIFLKIKESRACLSVNHDS